MRPMLFLAIQKAKQYKKKHNIPDYRELPEEMLRFRRFQIVPVTVTVMAPGVMVTAPVASVVKVAAGTVSAV